MIHSSGPPIPAEERDRNVEPEDVASAVVFACAAPPHVAIGHVNVWPIGAGIASTMA
jgi:NADP-dependent 3-hydroxy acid dehydrogenase YdfG